MMSEERETLSIGDHLGGQTGKPNEDPTSYWAGVCPDCKGETIHIEKTGDVGTQMLIEECKCTYTNGKLKGFGKWTDCYRVPSGAIVVWKEEIVPERV